MSLNLLYHLCATYSHWLILILFRFESKIGYLITNTEYQPIGKCGIQVVNKLWDRGFDYVLPIIKIRHYDL